jgi:hypothetical protein
MMVKLAQAGEGGDCTHTPFHYIYHLVQSCGVLYALAERADTRPPISTLHNICTLLCSHMLREGERGDRGEYVQCPNPSPLTGVKASLKMGFQLALTP